MADQRKDPAVMTDRALLREYEAIEADAGTDPRAETLIAEIQRRNLDL